MKHIPDWPRIRWSVRRDQDIGGIVLQGATRNMKTRFSAAQCISKIELLHSRFSFLQWCRQERKRIRTMLSGYIGARISV